MSHPSHLFALSVVDRSSRPTNLKRFTRLTRFIGSTALALMLSPLVSTVASVGAQTLATATVRGQVTDARGAVVTDADITIVNPATGLRHQTKTDAKGYFTLPSLPPTDGYVLSIAKSGFETSEKKELGFRAGETSTVNVTLAPAGTSATIVVYGTTEGIRSDSPQLGTRLDLQNIENTPFAGRKMTNLVLLDSAVRPARGTGDLFLNNQLFVVNGNGRRQTSFSIDGSTGDDSWGRQTVFTNVPLSALQEFTIQTNSFSAEYGRTTGAVVNIITKSGTNTFHGDVIGLWRPGDIQARAPLAAGSTADRLAQVSGVFSGPLVKDRTHFLISSEYNRQRRDSTVTSPLAPSVFTGQYRQTLFLARLDHRINDRNSLTGRITFDRFSDTNPADAVGGISLPSAARVFRRRTYALQLSETSSLGPSLVNEARVQMQVGSPITQFQPVAPSPQFVRTGISTEGESRFANLINHQYQIADTLSWVTGRHYLKIGGDGIFTTSGGIGQEFGTGFVQGQFTFNISNADVRNPAIPTRSLPLSSVQRYTQSFGNPNYNVRQWLSSVFVQDSFRVRNDLTLNFGVRYERQTFTDDTNNVAPRVGFAYNVGGDAKTVVRGGYGIYYSELRANLGAQYALNGADGIFTFSAAPGQLGFPTSFAPLPAFPAGAVLPPRDIVIRPGRRDFYSRLFDVSKLRGYQDALLNPYTQQATFGIERELAAKWTVSADYVYQHTIGIDRTVDLNAPAPFVRTQPGQTRSATAADETRPIRPVPNGFRRIQATVNEGSSIYHALQLNVKRRFGNSFSVLGSYTYSNAINTVEPDAPGGDPNDANQLGRLERAPSLLNQRHRAVISGWYRLPFRFLVGGVATLASGRPFNITTGVDNNGDGANSDRPVINGRVIGRNTGRNTAVYDVSPFVEREFGFGERVRVAVRAEAFNLLNHANIVGRNAVFGNDPTGRPLATLGVPLGGLANVDPGRSFQFSAHLRF